MLCIPLLSSSRQQPSSPTQHTTHSTTGSGESAAQRPFSRSTCSPPARAPREYALTPSSTLRLPDQDWKRSNRRWLDRSFRVRIRRVHAVLRSGAASAMSGEFIIYLRAHSGDRGQREQGAVRRQGYCETTRSLRTRHGGATWMRRGRGGSAGVQVLQGGSEDTEASVGKVD